MKCLCQILFFLIGFATAYGADSRLMPPLLFVNDELRLSGSIDVSQYAQPEFTVCIELGDKSFEAVVQRDAAESCSIDLST